MVVVPSREVLLGGAYQPMTAPNTRERTGDTLTPLDTATRPCAVDTSIRAFITLLPESNYRKPVVADHPNPRTAGGSFGRAGHGIGTSTMSDIETECDSCGYEWTYGGDMPPGSFVTCPACRRKTELEVSVDTES